MGCFCYKCHVALGHSEKCPQKNEPVIIEALKVYSRDSLARRVSQAHSCLLGRGSSKWPRMEHIREFCIQADIQRVGLAICSMFLKEALFIKKYFMSKGIESVIACCKIGSLRLSDIGVQSQSSSQYSLCNPVAQAMFLDYEAVEMNILMGLCAPHDMIFAWYSKAPVTTLFTKEHVSEHAPYHTVRNLGQIKRGTSNESTKIT